MVIIGELFTKKRFPSGWKVIPILIYLPIGLILAIIRVFIGVQVVLAATLLCKLTSIRSVVLRFMCGILGIFVFKENEEIEDDSVKVIVSNHVSIMDHTAIYLLKNSVSINPLELPLFLRHALNYTNVDNFRNQEAFLKNVKSLINGDVTVDVQPEMGITSGQKGLLRFSSWPCKLSLPIQPVAIKIWRLPFLEVSPSVINTSWHSDLFWFLFVPFTVFNVKFLPVVRQKEGETPEEMSKRLEKTIADELKICCTHFTVKDKVEYQKRLFCEVNSVKQRPTHFHFDPTLLEMASKVKEILSDVPFNVICKDLAITRSVDLTVANFLEGLIKYTPEKNLSESALQSVALDTKASLNTVQPSTSLDYSSKVFHKSAEERMISFQERKLRLIQTARQRYSEKHGLNLMNSG